MLDTTDVPITDEVAEKGTHVGIDQIRNPDRISLWPRAWARLIDRILVRVESFDDRRRSREAKTASISRYGVDGNTGSLCHLTQAQASRPRLPDERELGLRPQSLASRYRYAVSWQELVQPLPSFSVRQQHAMVCRALQLETASR